MHFGSLLRKRRRAKAFVERAPPPPPEFRPEATRLMIPRASCHWHAGTPVTSDRITRKTTVTRVNSCTGSAKRNRSSLITIKASYVFTHATSFLGFLIVGRFSAPAAVRALSHYRDCSSSFLTLGANCPSHTFWLLLMPLASAQDVRQQCGCGRASGVTAVEIPLTTFKWKKKNQEFNQSEGIQEGNSLFLFRYHAARS